MFCFDPVKGNDFCFESVKGNDDVIPLIVFFFFLFSFNSELYKIKLKKKHMKTASFWCV